MTLTPKIDLERQANQMSIFPVACKTHVIRPFVRNTSRHPQPNYKGTGKAFVGILKPKETLNSFKNMWVKMKLKSGTV